MLQQTFFKTYHFYEEIPTNFQAVFIFLFSILKSDHFSIGNIPSTSKVYKGYINVYV